MSDRPQTRQNASRRCARWLTRAATAALAVTLAGCGDDRHPARSPDPVLAPTAPSAIHPGTRGPVPSTGDSATPDIPGEGPVTLTLAKAIIVTLEYNPQLRVDRLTPEIDRNNEIVQRAVFDPVLTAGASVSRDRTPALATSSMIGAGLNQTYALNAGISQFLPTGTTVSLSATSTDQHNLLYSDELVSNRIGLTIDQSLLRGFGSDVNLVSVRQAHIDTLVSEYQLRGFVLAMVADVENTYWSYALALEQMEIVERSLDFAKQQFHETSEMIAVGKLAPLEIAASQAEVALRNEDLINARGALQTTRLHLLELLNLPGAHPLERDVVLADHPFVPHGTTDPVTTHIAVAERERPEINEARLQVRRGDLTVIQTRNGLLPQLNLFATIGGTVYSDSVHNAVQDQGNGSDALIGLSFSYPLGNRSAEASYASANTGVEQARDAVDNLVQTVEVDVRNAYIQIERTHEQIAAATAARKAQEALVASEVGQFRVGKATSLAVAQAQRDLLSSQITEVSAVVAHLQALVSLYQLDGSLLDRRGVDAPGSTPIAP